MTGCLAGAIGAAGANAEKDEDIGYYLKTNDVEPRIREAMQDRQIVDGMTPPQVRLTMGAKTDYDARPNRTEQKEEREIWFYENTDPMTPATYRITFKNGTVTSHVEE